MSLELVTDALDRARIPFAVIGAVALALRGSSRSTLDVDLLVTEAKVLNDAFWENLRSAGLSLEVRRGDFDDPLAGVVRFHAPAPVDLVVGKFRWQVNVIERAQPLPIGNLRLPVAQKSDLVLLKIFAGGYSDLQDVARLLDAGDANDVMAAVNNEIESLPKSMQDAWMQFLQQFRRS